MPPAGLGHSMRRPLEEYLHSDVQEVLVGAKKLLAPGVRFVKGAQGALGRASSVIQPARLPVYVIMYLH